MAANDVTSFLNSAEQYLKDKHAASFSDATWRAQKDVMEPLCSSDDSNVIGILPTGTGKSFIYQYYAREHNGSVLVIEPLRLKREQHGQQ